MSRIKGHDTKPELVVRSMLHRMGYRFRLHRKDLPGKPDIVLPKHKKVIFVNGCFWHQHEGCAQGRRQPKSNQDYWDGKLLATVERDRRNIQALEQLGWRVLVVWECELKERMLITSRLDEFLS